MYLGIFGIRIVQLHGLDQGDMASDLIIVIMKNYSR